MHETTEFSARKIECRILVFLLMFFRLSCHITDFNTNSFVTSFVDLLLSFSIFQPRITIYDIFFVFFA